MGNFVGYIYDEERAAQNVFMNAIISSEYKQFYSHLIIRAVDDLWEAMKAIKDGRTEMAEKTIRSVYERWRLEPDGRDNWFCYDLADRIVRYAGKEPIIKYEE